MLLYISSIWKELLDLSGQELVLRAIASAKIKTDKLDAVKLADLLRGGYISRMLYTY
jgi:hypothetical protein